MSTKQNETVYKLIPNLCNYRAGTDGSVQQIYNGYWVDVPISHTDVYPRVWINKRYWKVHHLILLTFAGPCPTGLKALHRNDNKQDCQLSNLYYGTSKQNTADMFRNGTDNPLLGVLHQNSKLSEQDILEIRNRAARGEKQIDIAQDKNISQVTVSKIVRRKLWKHV